jgi:hypothetical protein
MRQKNRTKKQLSVSVEMRFCVCVCERERERGEERCFEMMCWLIFSLIFGGRDQTLGLGHAKHRLSHRAIPHSPCFQF